MKQLRDKLAADLVTPRPLTEQVVRALLDRCELQSNEVADYMAAQGADWDEPLVDMIFSPIYTPTWSDRARYVTDRERVEVTPQLIALLVRELDDLQLAGQYPYENGTITMRVPGVLIERWVERLQLQVKLSSRVTQAIEATIPTDAQDMVKALAGAPAWQAAGREDILTGFLTGFSLTGRFTLPKFEYLTGLVHTYRPRDLSHFAHQVDALVTSYQDERDEHFFDAHLKEAYGAEGGLAPTHDGYATERKQHIALASQLQQDLADLASLESSG